MTVSSSNRKNTYAGDDGTTVFAYTFRTLTEGEILVQIKDTTTEVITDQTITTDYTVSGAGDASGGNVTMVVAPATGENLIITRDMDFKQETDYTENDIFPAESHETALDKVTMETQQLLELIERTVSVGADISGFSSVLPDPEADKYLKYNSAADAFELSTLSDTLGLGNVVEDTTPQLGGNLDLNGSNISGTGAISATGSLSGSVLNVTADSNQLVLDSDGTYTTTITDSAASSSKTITLPNATDTLVGKATTDTLTNKTIDADNNTVSNIVIGAECTGASTALTDTADITYDADTDASAKGWVIDEDDMATDSATRVPTQQSTKAYADAKGAGVEAISAYRNGTQAIATSTHVRIEFNAELFDVAGSYDSVTNFVYTPTVAGKYFILAQMVLTAPTAGTLVVSRIRKNGSARSISDIVSTGTNTYSKIFTIDTFNGTTDSVDVSIWHNEGSSLDITAGGSDYNFLQCTLLN